MPPCVGDCIRKEYESKIPPNHKLVRDRDCDPPPDKDVDAALKDIADQVKADTKTQDFGCQDCCPKKDAPKKGEPKQDCPCNIPKGQKPSAWSKWREIPYSAKFAIGKCHYEVIQEVKIRSRTYTGSCGSDDDDE